MINDTPKSPKPRITQTIKRGSKSAYDGGFHVAIAAKKPNNNASKRSSTQTFTCG